MNQRERAVFARVTGLVVVVAGDEVVTVYRNDRPLRHIGKKPRWKRTAHA
jgi:hypothetical protein